MSRPHPPPRSTGSNLKKEFPSPTPEIKLRSGSVFTKFPPPPGASAKGSQTSRVGAGLSVDFLRSLDKVLIEPKANIQRQKSEPKTNNLLPPFTDELLKPKKGHKRSISVDKPKKGHKKSVSVAVGRKEKNLVQAETAAKRKSLTNGKSKKLFKFSRATTSDDGINSEKIQQQTAQAQAKEEYATSLIASSLELLGYSKQDISSIQTYLSNNYKTNISAQFTSADSLLIDGIVKRSSGMTNINSRFNAATKIQTLFRSSRVRSTISPLLKNKEELERVKTYSKHFRELLLNERKYVENLNTLIQNFLTPARQKLASGKEFIQIQEVSYIFSNCEIIIEAHQKILQGLEDIFCKDWPLVRGVGNVILDGRKGLTAYGVYVGNYANAMETLQSLRSDKNGRFTLWVQEIEAKLDRDISSLLAAPLGHISKLGSYLEKLSGSVKGIEEEQAIINAYGLIDETDKFVKEQRKRSENTAILMKLKKRILHTKPVDIVSDDRRLIMETQFKVAGSIRTFILLNDSLIVGKPSKNQFRLKEYLPLEVVQFEGVLNSNATSFVIKTPTTVYKLSGKVEECSKWIKWLTEYQESNRMNRTIGVALPTILEREGDKMGIPSIVTQCIEHIRSVPEGTSTEGIFRISGELPTIEVLEKIFDNLAPEDRDFSTYEIHAVTGVLKKFFRALPEPLLKFSLYETFLDIDRNGCGSNAPLTEEQVEAFKAALSKLGNHYNTLSYLMRFLFKDICSHSEVSKMTPSNLSIVFGPTLMRPEVETMETTLNSPLVNHAVKRMIENCDIFFPETK